ncbi:eRF1 domain 1 [uncultured archaeon]|nr:eRF1 domain 1 [uncultured archaeon]
MCRRKARLRREYDGAIGKSVMKVIRFNPSTNELKLVPESFDDLYLLARIIGQGDGVTATTYRRFRPTEGDVGEQKEVVIELEVEKVEIDKNSFALRLTGKILGGRPAEYVRMGSYHTINLSAGDSLVIRKPAWKEYVLGMIRQAVLDSKKPKLGVVAVDDEKASFAYVKGYGIEIVAEMYSHLSKKMKPAEYEKTRDGYFAEIAKKINGMPIDLVVVAGPGFTKDDFKRYLEAKGATMEKRIIYASASDAERSGIREAMQSDAVSKLLEGEKIKREFEALNTFLGGLGFGSSYFGTENVKEALEAYQAGVVMVNDSALNDPDTKDVLDIAYAQHVDIMVFNSDDDAGMQLKNFKNIAAIGKSFMKRSVNA